MPAPYASSPCSLRFAGPFTNCNGGGHCCRLPLGSWAEAPILESLFCAALKRRSSTKIWSSCARLDNRGRLSLHKSVPHKPGGLRRGADDGVRPYVSNGDYA